MNKNFAIPILILCITGFLSIAILPIINKTKKPGEDYLSYLNPAEKVFLEKSKRLVLYDGEHLPVIETDNPCELGKLAALSFLHWVKDHPYGVAALPSGKTPDLFIEYLKFYREHWNEPAAAKDLRYHGIHEKQFPETQHLRLVQINEFFPINEDQPNSGYAQIKKSYLDFFKIPKEQFLAMNICSRGIFKKKGYQEIFPDGRVDLTLIYREPASDLESMQKKALGEVQKFCCQYEEKIREWGGIGFFLGGIGPDGHVAFNMPGSSLDSKTRLVQLNYPAAATAAGDLGGIEYSRNKTALTIGLETLTFNKNGVIILMAAGEAKAPVVAQAVEKGKDREYPATVLQGYKGARLYVTKGAASHLEARILADIQKRRYYQIPKDDVDKIVIELALSEKKRIVDLTNADFLRYPKSAVILRKYRSNPRDLLNDVRNRLIAKVEKGLKLPKDSSLLHTGPHHDDIMLSYHPLMRRMISDNQNTFVYLTSGFNSVTNSYMVQTLNRIPLWSLSSYAPEIFNHEYSFALRKFISAAEMNDKETMARTETLIMLKNICRIYGLKNSAELEEKVKWLKEIYFPNQGIGAKDSKDMQILKGSMRESESERMLLMAGVPLASIVHMRAGFYSGDFLNPLPALEKDAKDLVGLYDKVHPQIITVALDPEGTGPDTHYKVLQVVAQAVRMAPLDGGLRVWGYRNVWHRFSFAEATLMAPVSQEEINMMNHAFLSCFSTQKAASFPSPDFDGPFSKLAEKIQKEQFEQLKVLLGEAYFLRHSNPSIRNARGFIFIREMNKKEFLDNAKEIKSRIELVL